MKKNGFTLVELLVVATIVLLMSAIAVVSYQTAQRKSRDSKRKTDLEQVRAALEMYRSDEELYPIGDNFSNLITLLRGSAYLSSTPTDPRGYAYFYNSSDGYTYTLCTYLEGEDPRTCSSSCGDVTCNYGVTNP